MMKTTHTVTPKQPFNFEHTIAFASGFSPTEGEQHVDERALRLRKAYEIGGRAVLAEVATGQSSALSITFFSETPLAEAEVVLGLERVRFTLSLDDDLEPFYRLAEKDGAFAPVVDAQYGHHHLKFPSAFEIAVWAVLAQRTPMRVARAVKCALVAAFGTSIDAEGERYAAFPSAARLAKISEAALRAVVKNVVKTAAIAEIARAFEGVDERWLRHGPFAEVKGWLARLPRIGAWSTAFILYRGLGRMEKLEQKEGPIVDCFRAAYGPRADIDEIATSYGEHVGAWCLYLRTAGTKSSARGRSQAA
jgi:DNA-3-methyladenine glycosylase II